MAGLFFFMFSFAYLPSFYYFCFCIFVRFFFLFFLYAIRTSYVLTSRRRVALMMTHSRFDDISVICKQRRSDSTLFSNLYAHYFNHFSFAFFLQKAKGWGNKTKGSTIVFETSKYWCLPYVFSLETNKSPSFYRCTFCSVFSYFTPLICRTRIRLDESWPKNACWEEKSGEKPAL